MAQHAVDGEAARAGLDLAERGLQRGDHRRLRMEAQRRAVQHHPQGNLSLAGADHGPAVRRIEVQVITANGGDLRRLPLDRELQPADRGGVVVVAEGDVQVGQARARLGEPSGQRLGVAGNDPPRPVLEILQALLERQAVLRHSRRRSFSQLVRAMVASLAQAMSTRIAWSPFTVQRLSRSRIQASCEVRSVLLSAVDRRARSLP